MARTNQETPGSARTKTLTKGSNGSTPRRTRTPDSSNFGYLRQRLERRSVTRNPIQKLGEDDSFQAKTSPTLERLRMTPGRVFKDRQTLIMKHAEAKDKVDCLSVGGGVAMWPEMERMRLSRGDTVQIILVAITLFSTVIILFNYLHGAVMSNLLFYYGKLKTHHTSHPVTMTTQEQFNMSLISWHKDFTELLNEIHQRFDVSSVPLTYHIYICCYAAGLGTLMYYLYDSMFAKNKLSPKRIKKWVCLLTVIGTWTLALACLLVCAYLVETTIQINVHLVGEVLGDALTTNFDLTMLGHMLDYWKMRCLPPTTAGMLTILGVVAVKDVMYYLQYYSLPIITVLFTPVFKLIVSLYTIYNIKTH
ncbi:uncharacterized protein LOC117334186 [Pecten maximus]|uniref:uncharacterized protein LOC117334186 n=1 Tax=Pecten maximus TaxID=6579 RepID=UPI0014582B77|nr:uncharacterized protein LOC117334186 [Pecten maximus]XP_033749557.1 uncharacterized protein LOC117334186 [Pecten maximus]